MTRRVLVEEKRGEIVLREVIEGDKGKEMRRNSTKWKELVREAVDEGGSSDRNINEFVSKLCFRMLKYIDRKSVV